MAQTPYTTKILQAYAGLNVLKPAIQTLARDGKTDTEQYRSLVKQLQDAQTEYDKLVRAEQRWKDTKSAEKNKKSAEPKQGNLDIALAEGDKAKVKQIAQEMADAGVQPMGLDGKPLTGYAPKAAAGTPQANLPQVTQGYKTDSTGAILDNKGKPATGAYVIADPKTGAVTEYTLENGFIKTGSTHKTYTTDGKFKTYDINGKEVTETPVTPAGTPQLAANKPATGATGGASGTGNGTGGNVPPASGPGSDPKGVWVSALKQTFQTGIDDPKQKTQIDTLIDTAKREKWNEATFMEAIKNTSWWQQTLPTLRQFFIESHDPRNAATFAQTMVNKIGTVQESMEKLGIKINDIDPVTGKVIDNTKIIQGVAAQALQNGWSDAQIQEHLASKSEVIFTGGGALGSFITQIKQQALNYGVSLDANQMATINRDLLNPKDGKDAQWYLNNIKQQAIDSNPQFAASLKEGRSLYDVTSSYRRQMSDLLEVDPTNITWNDLMSKVINKDKGTANTFADFTKLVKQDPLWQKTKNAKETYSNMASDLMKQFGFLG